MWLKTLLTAIKFSLAIAFISLIFIGISQAGSLDFADFKSTSDGGVEIRLSFSESAPNATDFTSKNPARISLDLPKTKNNLPWSLPLPVETGGVASIKATQTKGRTRVVLNMDQLAAYTTRTEANNLFVTVEGGSKAAKKAKSSSTKAKSKAKRPTPSRRAASGRGNKLESIKVDSLAGEKVRFTMRFSRSAEEPGSFTIDNPARIALDFPGATSRLGWKNKNVGIGFAKSITAVQAGSRTRVILNLVQLIPFETQVSGRNVIVTLAGNRAASPKGKKPAQTNVSTAVPGDNTRHSITNIDFRRGNKGEGRIVVSLSDPDTPASSGESGQQIFVDFGNTRIPKDLQQRLDVIDFATPVQYIDANKVGNRVRLAITPAGQYEYLAYHTGSTYTVEVKPIVKTKEEKKKEQQAGYTGEKLSLNFQDIEVRAVLQLIADFTNLNMVTSDSVSGNLTLRLKNVPWDQALDIVLKTKGLGMRRTGNVLLVAPSEEIAAREKLELEAKKQIEELEPTRTELIQINYAKAEEIAELLKTKGTSVMSDRGTTAVDKRTNTLIAVDTAERLIAVRKLIGKLDIPIRQVLIDSRIVIASNDFAKDLGIRFGTTGVGTSGQNLVFNSGSIAGTDTMAGSAMDNQAASPTNNPYPIDIPTGGGGIPQRLNVNMPISASNAGRIAFSILGADTLLDLELSALQTEGKGEVVSNPRVVTANQQEATIQQGTEIPYQEASSSGATAVSFKEAVLALKVRPQITPDDRIFLDLTVSKDSVGTIFGGIPSIDTKEVKTQVLIDNGETIVLGGIYEQQEVNSSERVPFLGDLPFIGALFRSKHTLNNKEELLIFVTPKILRQSINTRTTN